jgi:translocation and assembly module TamB
MVLVILLTYALVGTEYGFKLTSGQLSDRVPGLTIDSAEGNLLEGVKTNALTYETDQMIVKANGIDSEWSSELFGRKFDIQHATIDEIDLQLFESDTPAPVTPRETITLPDITLPITFKARNILVKKLKIKTPGENAAEHIVENVKLSISAEDETVQVHNLEASYQNFSTKVSGEVSLREDYPLNIKIITEATDIIEDADLLATTTLSNTLERLFIQSEIKSPVSASLRGVVQPLDKNLPANLKLAIEQAGWPLETSELALLEDLNLLIDGSMENYEFSLGTNASGQSIPETELLVRGVANPNQVLVPEINIQTLGGNIKGNAGLMLGDAMRWVSNLNIDSINPGIYQENLDGNLNGKISASGEVKDSLWSVDLSQAAIEGMLRGFPFMLDTKLNKSLDNTLSVESFTLENGRNYLETHGQLNEQWDIAIDADLPELQNFLPGLAGGFKANGVVNGELKEPNLQLTASAPVLKLNDLLMQGLEIDVDVQSAFEQNSYINITAKDVNQAANTFSNIAIKLDGTRAKHTLKTFLDGPSKTSLDLLASGSLSDSFDWIGALENTAIELPGHKLELEKPVELQWQNADTQFSIDPHCWISVDASVCLENQVKSAAAGNAEITINNYALEQLNLFLPAASQLRGIFTANTTLAWGDNEPGGYSANITANIKDGTVKVTDPNGRRAEFKYKRFEFTTEATPENVDATLSVSSSTMGNADIVFNMNPTADEQLISGNVSLDSLSIGLLKAFLPDIQTIEGTIKAEGEISGSLVDPKFDGNIHLENLQLAAEALPLAINDGDITTRIKGKRAFIFGEIKSGEGLLAVEGSSNWQEIEDWRASIGITGQDLSIVLDPITESVVNPEIMIALRPGTVDVTGTVEVPRARIDIKEIPKGATTLSSDIVIVEDVEEDEKRTEELENNNLVARVNVDVNIGDDVKLSGYGLDASLTGNMNVRIVSPKPVQLGGELRIVKGVYKSYGQDLTIEDGQILFVGPIDQTSLDMAAVRTIEGEDIERKAGLRLSGKIADPEVTLFTDPSDKSQEAILSYIVLGRDIGETSNQESSLLASAALALTLRGGRDVGGSIAENLGIKEFSLDARGKGDDTEVIVSGRLNDRLLLRYGRNIFEPESTLYLRYDISKKLYLEAARGIERAVDLFYSFSF